MRRNLRYIEQSNFRGGINLEPSSARANEVLDARNVYINERGDLVKRPGARFASFLLSPPSFDTSNSKDQANIVFIVNGSVNNPPSGGISADIDVGEYHYFGFSDAPNDPTDLFFVKVFLFGTVENNNPTEVFTEFWNGTRWQKVETQFYGLFFQTNGYFNDLAFRSGLYLSYDLFPYWKQNEVEGLVRYWLRVRALVEDTSSTFVLGIDEFTTASLSATLVSAFSIDWSTQQTRYQYVIDSFGLSETTGKTATNVLTSDVSINQPGTAAVIPEFNVGYFAYNNTVYALGPNISTEVARVNSDPSIVGPADGESNTIYDRDDLVLLDEFPAANYILYFQGRLWAAGIKDKPFEIRWSGPALDGAYNIWPSVSFETLSEDDNSPITGLASLNEHPVVFKRDSIWLMVFSGVNELGLATYRPIKVVSGIGTVSQASISNVNGRLIFLAEDGFYMFDGTPNVVRLSDKIDDQVAKIAEGRKKFATSVHWRTKNLYLCAASVEGADENNFVFVYDYKNGGWWFWDGLSVQSWLREEGDNDRETILFGDTQGRIFELTDRRRTDAGKPIEAYVTTMRLGYGDGVTKRWRDLRVWGPNSMSEVDVELLRYDEGQGENVVTFEDETEAKWDVAEWNEAEWAQDKRRARKIRIRETSEWIQLKFSHDTTDRFELYGYSIGSMPLGIR